MLGIRLFTLALVSFGLVFASVGEVSAQKLWKGSWIAESFGNDKVGVSFPGPTYACTAGASACFQAYGMPQGRLCNPLAPRCNLSSTPTDTGGNFNPLGPNCLPLTPGQTPRPVKGATAHTASGAFEIPLFRNPNFFTSLGAPNTQYCAGSSSYYSTTTSNPYGYYATTYLGPGNPQRGYVQKGAPVSGSGYAKTTGGAAPVAFSFPKALPAPFTGNAGMRRTTSGEFSNIPPYLYSYTYAQLRNDAGNFAAGAGFFTAAATASTAMFTNTVGATQVAKAKVTRGANRFGGTMKMLGSLTTKVCYFYASGCSLGTGTWKYENIGAAAAGTAGGVATAPFTSSFKIPYYNTGLASGHTTTGIASRFPWTTGTVLVSATVRGPHKTYQVRKGFDNRNSVSGLGSVQLVSPSITTWLGVVNFETAGVGVLKMDFVPEPGVLVGLVAGLSLLGVLYRVRS